MGTYGFLTPTLVRFIQLPRVIVKDSSAQGSRVDHDGTNVIFPDGTKIKSRQAFRRATGGLKLAIGPLRRRNWRGLRILRGSSEVRSLPNFFSEGILVRSLGHPLPAIGPLRRRNKDQITPSIPAGNGWPKARNRTASEKKLAWFADSAGIVRSPISSRNGLLGDHSCGISFTE